MVSWKSFIILKEIKLPAGSYLRICYKNKAWNCWATFYIYKRKSQQEIEFLPIFYSLSWTFGIFTALEKTDFFQKYFRSLEGDHLASTLSRRTWISNERYNFMFEHS